ncbi:autotransporter-associated beta strand protein, partial [Chthoniobacter flavus]
MYTSTAAKFRKGAKPSRFFIRRLSSWLVLSTALTLGASKVAHASTLYWDADGNASGDVISSGAGLGGPGTWDTSTSLWWDGVSLGDVAWSNSTNAFDTAFFTGTAGTVTVSGTIDAGVLAFNTSGYLLSGGTINLDGTSTGGASAVNVAPWSRDTIASLLSGSAGFVKTGRGTLVLTNNSNSLSGDFTINDGSVVITNVAQLGMGTTTIAVTGIAGTGNPGYSGGQLVLQGGLAGTTFNREISLLGRGPDAANSSGALVSIGNNTFTADVTVGSAASETRLVSAFGNTTLSGGLLTIGTGGGSVFYGNGNWIINDQVTGFDTSTDRFIKTGNTISTTLTLTNTNNNFLQTVRLDSGTVRVNANAQLGNSTVATTSQGAVDFNGGVLEVRTDSTSDFANRSFRLRGNGNNTLVVGRAVGGSALNQAIQFGAMDFDANGTLNVSGIDGIGASFTGTGATGLITLATGGTLAVNNNSNGTVKIDASITRATEGSVRNVTFGGNGDMLLTGYILQPGTAGTGNIQFVKTGNGTFTLTGANITAASASTYNGSTFVQGGTLQILGATATINNLLNGTNGGALQLGNSATFGALDYRGAGETTSKVLNLPGSTGAGMVLANETGATPLVFSSAVGASGVGAKNLYLGGSSTLANEIAGVINSSSSGATSLVKIGSGTWLYDPAASSYAAGGASVAWVSGGGTNTNTFTVAANTPGIAIGETVSGDNAGGVVIGWVPATGVVTISNNISTAMAAGNVTFGANNNFTGAVTVTNGTLQVKPTAASGASGGNLFSTTNNLVFNADSGASNGAAGGTFELATPTAATLTANLAQTMGALTATAGTGKVQVDSGNGGFSNILSFNTFGTRSAGAALNFAPAGSLAGIQFVTAPTGTAISNGILGGFAYITNPTNGSIDFVAAPSNATNIAALNSVTPLPTATGGAANDYVLNASTATTAGVAANSIRITGTPTLALGGTLTITSVSATQLGGILFDNSSGAATISGAQNIASSTAGQELVFVVGGAGGTGLANALTVSSTIGNGSSSAVTKAGNGMLIVGGTNTFTGNLTLDEGTIKLAGGTAATLGSPAAGSLAVMRQGTVLDVNNSGASLAPYTGASALNTTIIGVLAGTGTIDNTSATASAISLGNSASTGSQNFSGIIQNSGGGALTVIKDGASGVQSLSGLNTYTGATVIRTGTLQVTSLADGGHSSSIGASSNAASNLIFKGGTLQYTGDTTTGSNIYQTSQTPSVSTDRLFTLEGNATLDSSGTYGNVVAAARVANNAALVFSNAGAIAYSTTGAKTLTLQGDSIGDNQINLQLADPTGGALSVTKTGTGHWILGGTSNSYTGTTTVSSGALEAVDGSSLPSTSNLTLNGGVFQTSGNFTRAFGTGAGKVQLTGGVSGFAASTAPLNITLDSGNTLTWGSATFNPTGLDFGSSSALFGTTLTNNINLGSAARAIQVDTNSNTSTAQTQATVSGVISGVAGGTLTKNGAGNLILGDSNTYVGNTIITNGSLTVSSIGNSTGTVSSSLGASGGSLVFNSGTNTANLLYVGPGETPSRPISITSGAATIQIDSSGSGALVLPSITNGGTSTLTLQLRGTNMDNNMVTSQLTNGVGVLTVTKADGGVWILNPSVANTFSGNININGGTLGLTANAIGNAAAITIQNGALLAWGGDLSTTKPLTLTNNSTAVFEGSNNITFTSNVTKAAGANDQTISNNLENGALLTINGNLIDAETGTNATRTISVRGNGSTVWNGIIQDNTSVTTNIIKMDYRMANGTTFTLSGGANTYTGGTVLGQGTLILNKVGALGGTNGTTTGVFTWDGGVIQASTDLSGATNKIANPVNMQGDFMTVIGTNNIEFGAAAALNASRTLYNNLSSGTLTFSGSITNSAAATLTIAGTGNTAITGVVGTGTGAQALTYSGTGTLSLTGTNTATGVLTANRGLITLSGTSGGTWNAGTVAINSGGILRLDNGGGDNAAGRLQDAGAITVSGGTLDFIGSGTTAEIAGAVTVNSAPFRITTSSGTGGTLTFASISFGASGSALDLNGVTGLGSTNKIKFASSTGLGASNNVLARVFIGGSDFAAYDSTNGVVAFSAYNTANNIDGAAAVDTLKITTGTTETLTKTVNAVMLNGGVTLGATGVPVLTVTSGGFLANGGANTLSVPDIALTTTGTFQVANGSSLNLTGSLTGAQTFSKALPGSMTFSAPQYFTSTINVVDGTLNLAGGLNTIYNAGGATLSIDRTATVDLNGNTQYVGALSSPGTLSNIGGTVTSSSGSPWLVTNNGGSTFAGQITGSGLNFARVGTNSTMALESAQTYQGRTVLMAGTLTLENDATILNTSAIDINYATLNLSNNSSLQIDNTNRISDSAPITMRGGTLTLTGRVDSSSAETVGAVSLTEGANSINSTWGSTGQAGAFSTTELTLTSLSRSAGTTVNFSNTSASGGTLGAPGNNPRIFITSPLTALGVGVLGPWAIANSGDYAAYNTTNGIGVVGTGGFAGYDVTFGSGKIVNLGGNSAVAVSTTLPAGTTVAAMLRLSGGFQDDLLFTNSGDLLDLEMGGLLRSNNANNSNIGSVATPGILTAGTNASTSTELVVYNNQGTVTINSTIQDTAATAIGGTGTVSLVKSGAGTLTLTNFNGYSGGTVVDQGTLNLSGGATANGSTNVVIPGNLTINGGVTGTGTTVAMVTNQGQIAATSNVTMNGHSTLTLVGNNTLNSLTLNDDGGDTAGPTVTPTGILTLTSTTPITATSSNAATAPTLGTGTLALAAGTDTISVGAIQLGGQTYTKIAPGLIINSAIIGNSVSLLKTGNGLLQLGGNASTFAGGVTVNAGGLIIAASSVPAQGGAGLASGPLGTGTLTMGAGLPLLVNASQSVGNSVTFADGTPVFDTNAAANATMSLNGSLSFGSATSINASIANPFLTVALLGPISNISNITSISRTGLGNLVFNSAGYTGNFVSDNLVMQGTAVSLLNDGDGYGDVQTISLPGSVIFDTGIVPNIAVGRAGGTLPLNQAQNKIIAPASINNANLGITVTNNNGYGLQSSDNVTLINTSTFTVANATNSNVVQGLYLEGVLGGTGFIKTGAGAVVLGNAGNTFTGNVNIQQGVVSVDADAELGTSTNKVLLNSLTSTSTLRATSTFTLNHTIQLTNTANTRAIEVTAGNTLTLNAPFDLNSNPTATLAKSDNGTLSFASGVNNTGWTGIFSINAGAILLNAANNLGGATVNITNAVGGAVQLTGGITVANALTVNATGSGGINSGGVIESVSGNNTWSGAITQTSGDSTTVGADVGATLNITGTWTAGNSVTFTGGGTINLQTALPGYNTFNILGDAAGDPTTVNLTTNSSAAFAPPINIRNGTFSISGAGVKTAGTGLITVSQGSVLSVDDTAATTSRFSGRPLTLEAGVFNYKVSATSSTEVMGALALNSGGSTINIDDSLGGNNTLTFASFTSGGGAGSALNVTGTFGTASNKITFTTAPTLSPATTGILARVTTNGNEFATYNASTGLTPFAGYSSATDISTTAATDTYKATTSTANTVPTSQTLNALTLNGGLSVDSVDGVVPTTLTLTSGAVLNQAGNNSLDVQVVALGATEGLIHVANGTTLSVSSGFSGTGGMTKALPGSLVLTQQQYVSGNTTVEGGTMQLAGGTNTLLFNNGLVVNNGGTLDLNGTAQYVGNLASQSAGAGVGAGGGIITTTGGSATLVTNSAASTTFGGQITGAVSLIKAGTAGTLTLVNSSSYTGPTIVTGGTLTLTDGGALTGTSSVTLSYGSLSITDSGLFTSTNRINDSAPITMRSGVIVYTGRSQTASSETLGALTIDQGGSNINATTGTVTGVQSVDLTFASITRINNGTLNINNGNGQLGNASRILFTSAPTLVNNLVTGGAPGDRGGWLVNGGADFVTYVPGLGLAPLGAVGAPNYDSTGLPVLGGATLNVKLSSNNFVIPDIGGVGTAGTYALNALNFTTSANQNLTFTDNADTLNLTSGGFLKNGANTSLIGSAVGNGMITAGGTVATGTGTAQLIFQQTGAATTTMNSAIVDNAATGDAVRLVYTSYNTGVLSLAGVNTYSGGTVVNGWTGGSSGSLQIASGGVLPGGGLTINGGTVIQQTGGVITSQAVTINGAGTLTLAGNNTLTSLTFNNNGGGASTVTPTGVLTLTGSITSSPSNVGGIATIGTGTLDLNGSNTFSIVVNPTLVNTVDVAPWQAGLIINSVIQNGGIVKTGSGVLQLGGQSTFTGGVTISQGGLLLAADSTPPGSGPVTSGPLGTGTLTMASGTSLISNVAVRNIANDIVFQGNTTFNGTTNGAAAILNLNGNTTLPSTWNATITAPQLTVNIANVIGSTISDVINKSGLGVLNVGNYLGTLQISGGLVISGDGNTLGTAENVNLGGPISITGNTAIAINHSGGAITALNKTLQKSGLTIGTNTLALTNNSGYGLEITGTTTLTGTPTFTVANATASNVTQGLILTGPVVGAGDGIVKSGNGTLVLSNVGNSFGGVGSKVEIRKGVLSVSNDGALGDSHNSVLLNVNAQTGAGFRATGTFASSRLFTLNQASNAFEVTVGNVLTLNTAFGMSAPSDALYKNDNGVLELAADNTASGWNGGIFINAGAVRLSNSNAAGISTSVITITPAVAGAALQLNNVTIANPIVLASTANVKFGGLDFGGQVEGVAGTSTITGQITKSADNAIGVDSGAVLNINGGINDVTVTAHAEVFNTAGSGIINLNSSLTSATPTANQYFSVEKHGTGTLNITTANPIIFTSNLTIFAGTVSLNGAGTLTGGNGIAATVNPGGTLVVNDNSLTPTNNRLGSRPLTMVGGNFTLVGNTSGNTLETLAVPTLNRGYSVITVTAQSGEQANLVFTGSSNVPAGAQNSGTTPSGTSILFRGTSLGTGAGPGIATIQDTNATNGFAIDGSTGATNTTTKSILPYAILETSDTGTGATAQFATGDTVAGAAGTTAILRQLSANEMSTLNAAFVANVNEHLNGNVNVTASVAPNSLTMDSGGQVTISPLISLNLASGGILAKSGNGGISGGIINQTNGFSPLEFWTIGDLTVTSLFNGGNGTTNGAISLVKAGAGTLTLSTPLSLIPGLTSMSANSMSGLTVINQGTIKLNGGKNTLLANNFMEIGLGGTLDLNGNSQQVEGLFTDGAVPNSGGTVTSSTGTGNLVVNADNTSRIWAGSITGNVNFTRSGQNTLTLESDNTYVGLTLISGGTTVLRDSAKLSGTTGIEIDYATLTVDNNANYGTNVADRINDAAPITMRGGTFTINGRAQAASSETIGAVTLAQGYNVFTPTIGGTGVSSMDLTLASLTQNGDATVNFNATLGLIGSNPRILINTLNGVSSSTVGAGLTNNIIGGWAIVGNDFATYIPGLGVAALAPVSTSTGALTYDLSTIAPGNNSTLNARLTASAAVPNGGATLNALSMTGSNIAITFTTATDTLNLTSGGLIGPNNNQSIGGSVDSGRLTAGGLTPTTPSNLYIYNRANTLTINSRIIDNPNNGGSSVRAVFNASGGAISLTDTNNSYTGGTTLNGGTLNLLASATGSVIPLAANPANGLVINNATVTMGSSTNSVSQQIAAGNVVTLNGSSTLNLFGNNTLAGLVFNNEGGTGNPTVQTFSTATSTGLGSTGVLTIGSSGIVATSSNIGTIAFIEGRVDFGSGANTISVATINANGVTDIAPLQRGFLLRSVVNSTGGITKLGNGVLEIGAQDTFTGAFTVAAGAIRNGLTNAGSRYSDLTLNSGTRYDLNGASSTWGSLAGSGNVFNSGGTGANGGGAATLTVGFDNASTTFSGQFERYNDANPSFTAFTKIGNGTLHLTGTQSASTGTTGTVTVSGGVLAFDSTGAWFTGTTSPAFAGTFTVNASSTLLLDNTGTNVNNRLGLNATGTLNMQGGTLVINGNSSANTSETINSYTVANGGGTLQLNANANSLLNMTILTLGPLNGNGSELFQGINGTAAANGNATLSIINAPALEGSQGGGLNGTSNMSVRQDILVDASTTGLGTGFLVKDTGTNLYRALGGAQGLASTEYNLAPATWATAQNGGINASAQTLRFTTAVNTLTVGGTSSLASGLNTTAFGIFGPGGLLSLTENTSTVLVLNGGIFTDTVALNGTAGNTLTVHTVGTGVFNQNGYYGIGNTAGLIKADDGTMNLNNLALFTGTVTVNGGTLNLNSGQDNTIAVVPGATTPTVSNLAVNGTSAQVDLKNNNQTFGSISTINQLPGKGGTITNSGATVVTLTSTGGGTFAGSITGNIAFTRAGSNTTTLTSANTYTGPTIVRGGVLQLRDSGSISSTAGVTVDYGTLLWDNSALNPLGNLNPTRILATNPLTLQGGILTINGGGSTDTVVAMNSITVTGGENIINTTPFISEGSTVKLTVGNLVRNTTNHSGVNFNGFTTNNSSAGSNTLGGQGLVTNSNIILNQINGTTFNASSLVNGLIGGWAVADGSAFATYDNNFGVVAMNNTYGGFTAPAFTGTDVTNTVVTGNYNDAGSGTTALVRTMTTGAKTANSWRFAQSGASTTVTPVSGTTYSFGVGIITNANQTVTLGAVDATNTITGTGTDLYFYVNTNTLIINPAIIGNEAVVANGGNTLRLAPLFASNTYTGGTYINAGTTNLQAATGLIAIPGDLNINNATVTLGNATSGQVASTANLNINGGGIFNLFNYVTATTQSLNSVNFNNQGGNGNPTFAFGTQTAPSTIILTAANAITSNNDSAAFTPQFTTNSATFSALQLSNANPVITTSGLSPDDLNIAVPITSAGGMVTKAGNGSLTLSAASTFSNGFDLNQGTLIFGAATAGTPPTITSGPVGTGALQIDNGTTVLGASALTIGNAVNVTGNFTFGGVTSTNNLTFTGAVNLGNATRTISVSSPAVTATITGLISSTATGTAFIKDGPGTLVLNVLNTNANFGGAGVTVNNGLLKNGVDNAVPNASLLTVNAGAGYDLNGTNETLLQVAGGGFITNSAASSKVLTLSGSSATDVTTNLNSTIGAITDNHGVSASSILAVTKVGLGSLTLSGAGSNYFGTTTVVAGSLIAGTDNSFSPNSTVVLSNTTTAALTATLDATNGNQTIAGLQVTDNNATGGASVIVGSGKTLTVNGNVTIGSNVSSTDVTNASFTGGGSLVVNSSNGTIQLGGAGIAPSTNANSAIVDMSGLNSFTANLGSGGTFRIGDITNSNGGTGSGASSLTLAANSTINTGTLSVGDAEDVTNAANALHLGSGTNVINANTINIGSLTGGRSNGTLNFASGTGTLKIRAFDGLSAANLNIINAGNNGTGTNLAGVFDVTGHNADLLINTLTMAARSAGNTGSGPATATFSFDTGTLGVSTLNMSNRSGTDTTGTVTSMVNIGGGTDSLGVVTMAVNTAAAATGSAVATLNVSGGSVSATSINLSGANATGAVATGTLNITGGTLTMAGDITHASTTGSQNTTLTLNGGILDMAGHNIGSVSAVVGSGSGGLNLQSGTLRNVAQINGGAAISKTTAGVLNIAGTNTWTGATNVNGGTLNLVGGGSPTLGGTAVSVATGATLSVSGTTVIGTTSAGTLSISGGGNFSLLDGGINTLTLLNTTGGSLSMGNGAGLQLDLSPSGF